jgi:hypothetical protein
MTRKRKLTSGEKEFFKSWFSADILDRARVTEKAPFFLPGSFYGITLYNVIYLRRYNPDDIYCLSMLGHELVHVRQYAEGMTIMSYLRSCKKGYSKSCYEMEAYEMEHQIRKFLETSPVDCLRTITGSNPQV